jgi:hypothetical protein
MAPSNSRGGGRLAWGRFRRPIGSLTTGAGLAFVFGGKGGSTGSVLLSSVDTFSLSAGGTRGALATPLSATKLAMSAAGNTAKALLFGGEHTPNALNVVEDYSFSTSTGTVSPATLSELKALTAAAGNDTNAFVFGGANTGQTNASTLSTVENFSYATSASASPSPASLAMPRDFLVAVSNRTKALVMAGTYYSYPSTNSTSQILSYSFATGSSSVSAGSYMQSSFPSSFGFSNSVEAIVAQASTGGSYTTSYRRYLFATEASDGMSPAVLQPDIQSTACAGNDTVAFIFGGTVSNGGPGNSLAGGSKVTHFSYATKTLTTSAATLSDIRGSFPAAASNRSFS